MNCSWIIRIVLILGNDDVTRIPRIDDVNLIINNALHTDRQTKTDVRVKQITSFAADKTCNINSRDTN